MSQPVSTITSENAYADNSKPGPSLKPTYEKSVKIRDTGANTDPGHNAPPAPFVEPRMRYPVSEA
jgi:hypothetical protein